ncbi:MAG: hypothetical protein JXR77_14855 [Lentisphaeria bacterium]|nr:hypothetical protein [Lentisphaeria bacterium]
MNRLSCCLLAGACLGSAWTAAGADWVLAESLDRALVYTERTLELFAEGPGRQVGSRGGVLLRAVSRAPDGSLRPFAPGMAVGGEPRDGQILLSGSQAVLGSCLEFTVFGGSRIAVDYGLCDGAVAAGNPGSLLVLELEGEGAPLRETLRMDQNTWNQKVLPLPGGNGVLVRLTSRRFNSAGTNWTGLVVTGDGRIGTREETLARSPNGKRLTHAVTELPPSPHRVTARDGYDILFYKGTPFLSVAGKGHAPGTHAEQAAVGINTFYVEGATFARCWPEGAEELDPAQRTPTLIDLVLCQRHDMVYKTSMSLAHCTPFLPPWLVAKENLGFEDHQMRRGGPHHASVFRQKTLRFYKQGLQDWVTRMLDQPVVFVFSQEDIPEDLDDGSAEAMANWRQWLGRRFGGDVAAFSRYVGGLGEGTGFDAAPYPRRDDPQCAVGYPMRLAYLKLIWVQETYGEFLADVFAFMRARAPGVPLTQRYTNSAFGVFLSRRVQSDYNYTFGHLTVEGWPNAYAIGRKPWTGIYAHAGTLPLPRGGSIGKTCSRDIRRGPITEKEFRANAYTALANGLCGFEYSTVFPSWGTAWESSSLYSSEGRLTPSGEAARKVLGEIMPLAGILMHYEQFPDVAVFHDAPFNSRAFSGPWSQSKAGIYTLIRETGLHADPLTCWEMTPESLCGRKVLVLAGSLSIAPDIQEAIRTYVREGGTLVTVFCADVAGFPGCNGYEYAVPPRESAAVCSFEDPPAQAHLGDVLGLRSAGGLAARTGMRMGTGRSVSLDAFNALVEEGHWVDRFPCCARLVPAAGAAVTAAFEDGSPAVIENAFGQGRAITFACDLGLVANNLTVDPLCELWSDLLLSLGCRKAADTGNWRVEGGAWHDDAGRRVLFLVNHDPEEPQHALLPTGGTLRLAPGECRTLVTSP